MPTYELIAGTHVHGNDAEGNKRVFRASHYPRLEPGGAIPGAGEPDPLFKSGDNFIKTNRKFRVSVRGQFLDLTLDQRHPNKFRLVDPAPVPEQEEMLFMPIVAVCKPCESTLPGSGRFKVADWLAGKSVACPTCRGSVIVPASRVHRNGVVMVGQEQQASSAPPSPAKDAPPAPQQPQAQADKAQSQEQRQQPQRQNR